MALQILPENPILALNNGLHRVLPVLQKIVQGDANDAYGSRLD